MKKSKLFRSRKDKLMSGVIGGFGKLLNIDATILRLVYVLLAIFTGFLPFLLVYILCAAIMPLEPNKDDKPVIIEQPQER